MYVPSTNLQGPHSIPQFQVPLCEALLFCPTCLVQFLDLRVVLQFKFLVCSLMKEKMSKM